MEVPTTLTLALILLLQTGCGLLGGDPKEPELEPGSRNYTWTVDTLSSPTELFYMFSLWGDSPTDVWAVGPADESINSLWYFDGNIWQKTTHRLSSNLQSIFGFDSVDAWACNGGGGIFHYDGESWTKTGSFPYPAYSQTIFNSIWGSKPNEIYIAGAVYDQEKGTKATLLQYNGSEWGYINLPNKEMSFVWVRKSAENGLLYITAVQYLSAGDVYKILTYNGSSLKEIHSGNELAYAYEIAGKIYISIGKKVYKHQNNQLMLWKDFSQTTYLGNINGRNEKDFFSEASDGLAHYNGTDLKTIYPTNLSINEIFVMEKDVFLIGDYRVIIHGRLNNE